MPVFEANRIGVALNSMPDDLAANARYGAAVLGRPEEPLTPEQVDMQVGIRLLPSQHTLAIITRYESHLHRIWLQTLHELEAIQIRRHGGQAPLARLDISAPPAT